MTEHQEQGAEISEQGSEIRSEDAESIKKVLSPIEKKYADSQLRILRTAQDWPLHYVRQTLEKGDMININPIYQRRSRWDNKAKSLLIESFLLNIPVPPLYLYEYDYNKYEVMDGLQRFTAISGFLKDEYALRGLEFWKELNGKKYSQLPDIIQKGLLRRNLSAIVLLVETSQIASDQMTLDVRQALFNRLNTGGEPLNNQEIRNAMNPSNFNQMVHRLSRDDMFCEIWRISKGDASQNEVRAALDRNTLYRTMADCEIVLRVFAVKDEIDRPLGGSMKSILDRCLKLHTGDSDPQILAAENAYKTALSKWYNSFGSAIFIIPSSQRASRPLFDALMVALMRNSDFPLEDSRDRISETIKLALGNPIDYETLVGRGNTAESVHNRVNLAEKIINSTYFPADLSEYSPQDSNTDFDLDDMDAEI
jgi:Protein of unknown function DUF262